MKEIECLCFVEDDDDDDRCMICGKSREEHKDELEEEF